jgi:hypothetical protein
MLPKISRTSIWRDFPCHFVASVVCAAHGAPSRAPRRCTNVDYNKYYVPVEPTRLFPHSRNRHRMTRIAERGRPSDTFRTALTLRPRVLSSAPKLLRDGSSVNGEGAAMLASHFDQLSHTMLAEERASCRPWHPPAPSRAGASVRSGNPPRLTDVSDTGAPDAQHHGGFACFHIVQAPPHGRGERCRSSTK